jgi:hypothetical protein
MGHTDPLTLVESLDPEVIEAELVELARRRDALRVLLRAALARDKRRSPEAPQAQEVPHGAA